jgi:hypothetical protein
MTTRYTRRITLLVFLAGAGLAASAGLLGARSDGVSGKTQAATGCSCHSTTPNSAGGVTVTLAGPQSVAPGSTHSYTVAVIGGPNGTTGGFNLMASSGTLVPGVGSQLLNNELVHANNTRRSWTFDWTAPLVDGTANLYAVGMTSNGSGSNGDSWNWYGGAVGIAFPVTVSSLVAADDPAAMEMTLGPAMPSPTLGATTVRFSLARASSVHLSVFDLRGRRIAELLSGGLPAGQHSATWMGGGADGSRVAAGWYVIRLEAEGRVMSTRVLRLRS